MRSRASLRGKFSPNTPKAISYHFLTALSVQVHASLVNFFNPSHVFRGAIARMEPLFFAVVRESVYHRSLAVWSRRLDIQDALLERIGLSCARSAGDAMSLKPRGSVR